MRKQNKSSKSHCKTRGESRKVAKSTNDPQWYASDPSILRDAASIPFSWALGTTIDRGGVGVISSPTPVALPGIMRVDLRPNMGLSSTADSALNVASVSMYSYVRHANSGHANYDAPDLMLYCGAMSQVYAYINWCQRIYGLATMYAQKNRYLPRVLLTSMGVDPDDISSHLADMRYWINVMVSKASSLAVPATMSYFSRTAFLYSNIYCESESIKDQLYYFHPAAWYKFRFDSSTTAGKLEEVKLTPTGTLLTLSEIQRFGEEMLGVILMDEDFNIMSGDILKAYGIEHIIKLSSIDTYYPVIPIFDPMVLEQIHNMDCVEVDDVDVTQDPDQGYLMCQPMVTTNEDIYTVTRNHILSVDKVEPMPEDVIECTRLMCAGDPSRSNNLGWYVGAGTEISSGFHIFTLAADGALVDNGFKTTSSYPDSTKFTDGGSYFKLKMFKYAPTVFIVRGETNKVTGIFESVDNYAVLNAQDIYKLHDTALMNMLAVPSIAKVNSFSK